MEFLDKPVIIIGAGGHARVLFDCLRLQGVNVLGMLDKEGVENGNSDLPIIGDDSAISEYPSNTVELVNGLGSVGNMKLRTGIFTKFKNLGYCFRNVIHPSAIIAHDCELGEGVQVLAGAVINTGTKIAADTIVNTGAIVDHECIVGSHVHIAPGCTLSGGIHIGDGTHIGTGATIIQGISIGNRALVAAGAVVVKNVPDGEKVMGVPAKIV